MNKFPLYFPKRSIFAARITWSFLLKQSSRSVLWKMCSQKFCKTHRKTPVMEPLFWWSCSLWVCGFIKKDIRLRFFPVNFGKLLRTSSYCFCIWYKDFNYRLNKICGRQLQKHGYYHTMKEYYRVVQLYLIRSVLTFTKFKQKILNGKCN